MLVVISDLHFEECTSGLDGSFKFNRNFGPKAFIKFIQTMATEAKVNQARSVDIVLAGDIFELIRSNLWYQDDNVPHVHLDKILPGSEIEERILSILDHIAGEDLVAESLAIVRNFAAYFDVEMRLHYLVGNHDRLANATPAIRSQARHILGITDSPNLIPYTFTYQPDGRPLAFIRHGHEYDPDNFSVNYQRQAIIPENIPYDHYAAPPPGDLFGVELVNKLPYQFVQQYGGERIKTDPALANLFTRLMEFYDVRPSSNLLNYIFSTPGLKRNEIWRFLEPVVITLLQQMRENENFSKYLSEVGMGWKADMVKNLLKMGLWKKGIPYPLVRTLTNSFAQKMGSHSSTAMADREEVLVKNGDSLRCIISGHTHWPDVSLLDAEDGVERYHINTGTWRHQLPSSLDRRHFGRIKSFSNVVVYGPDENHSHPESRASWSFDFWSGYSQKFYDQPVIVH